jgi:hypothetical protein
MLGHGTGFSPAPWAIAQDLAMHYGPQLQTSYQSTEPKYIFLMLEISLKVTVRLKREHI